MYVVHFTQAAAVEHASSLLKAKRSVDKEAIAAKIGGFRFGAGFGKTLSKLVRSGVGVHHAGMLPKYRRLVEQLAQDGLLAVICGTDTLGVGINVPIRTVLFTGLAKFDGNRQRVLRTREFQQIAGRAGRAGFDTSGYVVVQAPEHVIDNERAKAKAEAKNNAPGANVKRKSKAQLKKPPAGTVVWTEQTFEKLVAAVPEPLTSRMRVDNAMLINVLTREEDAFAVMRRLLNDNHEDRRQQLRLSRQGLRLARSLIHSGVVTRLDDLDEFGRRFVMTVDLPADFALNQPLAHFALAAFDVLDAHSETYTLDVVSIVEAVLEAPRQILMAQQFAARGEAVQEMKADGIEYEERMALLDAITWPKPLADLLEGLYEAYRQSHPWLREYALGPKSILRYLSDAYRTLRQTVPEAHRTPELEDLIEWLGETIRQTDSSLLDEWEALADPAHADSHVTQHQAPAPPRPLSRQGRAFEVMIRNAMWARVALVARDDLDGLMRLERAAADHVEPARTVVMSRSTRDAAIDDVVLTDAEARGPSLLCIGAEVEGLAAGCPDDADAVLIREVRQTIHDPEGHHDWVIDAVVDCAASDEAGTLVLATVALERL